MGRGSPIVYHQMILLFEKCIEITTHFFCRRHSVEQFVSHALNIPRFHYRGNLYWGYISQEPKATFTRLLRNWKSLRIELPRVSYQTKYSFPCWLHISFWSLYTHSVVSTWRILWLGQVCYFINDLSSLKEHFHSHRQGLSCWVCLF